MLELPELTPEHFEILVMRELRKIGLNVSELRTHRRTTLPEPDRGYLLELKGVLRRPDWQRRTLIACRRQHSPIASVRCCFSDSNSTEPIGLCCRRQAMRVRRFKSGRRRTRLSAR